MKTLTSFPHPSFPHQPSYASVTDPEPLAQLLGRRSRLVERRHLIHRTRSQRVLELPAGTQVIRIPRKLDHATDVSNSNYWLELSPGGRDNLDNRGCTYGDFVTNCDHPFRLSLAMLTANKGDSIEYASHSTLVPITGSRDRVNHRGLGGLIEPPVGDNKTVFTDEKTGLTVELLEVNDNRDMSGNAKLRITLAKDLSK